MEKLLHLIAVNLTLPLIHVVSCNFKKIFILLSKHPLTSVSEGMITVRLSNKEIVITAVKVVITADPQESKFEFFC